MLDINPKIRFAAVYCKGDYYTKMREGLKSFLNNEETEKSMRQAVVRMNSRKLLSHKVGDIHYGLGKYDKMSRVTIPFGKDGLIMISIDPDAECDGIAEKIIRIREKFEYLLV